MLWHLTLVGALLSAAPRADDIPLSFQEVPYVFTRSPEVFTALITAARTRTVEAVLIGDSQETSPGGAGAVYIPRLNFEFYKRFGNSPASPWIDMISSTGGGQPWSDWLFRTSYAAPNVTESRVDPRRIPAGLKACKTSARVPPNVNGNQAFGQLVGLQHDATFTHPGAEVAGGQEYFKRGQQCWLDVIGAAGVSSGEIVVRVCPNDGTDPSFFSPTVALFTTQMGLQRPEEGVFKQRVGPLPFAGHTHMQVELFGSDPARLTDIVTCRFVGDIDTRGIALTDLAEGGTNSGSYLVLHDLSGPVLSLLSPEVLILAFGANDAPNGITPQQTRQNLADLIAFVRAATRDDLPVILFCDPYREQIPPQYVDAYDQLAGVQLQLAQDDPLVCAINSRRLTDECGWRAGSASTYLADHVHYSPAGAILKAQLEVAALFDTFADPRMTLFTVEGGGGVSAGASLSLSGSIGQHDAGVLSSQTLKLFGGLWAEQEQAPCMPDFNGDGFLDFFDLDAYVECFEGLGCPPGRTSDLDGDGFTDFFDFDFYVVAFETGC